MNFSKLSTSLSCTICHTSHTHTHLMMCALLEFVCTLFEMLCTLQFVAAWAVLQSNRMFEHAFLSFLNSSDCPCNRSIM